MTPLIGTYNHIIDAKGRMNFSSKLREILGDVFFMTRGIDQRCLSVYPQAEWEALIAKVAAIPEAKGVQIRRFLFSGAAEVTPDKQGRILIPQDLRCYANLTKDVVVIGAYNKAEVWDKSRWEIANAKFDSDAMMEAMLELGF